MKVDAEATEKYPYSHAAKIKDTHKDEDLANLKAKEDISSNLCQDKPTMGGERHLKFYNDKREED